MPQHFPYVALPKQDLIHGGAQGRTVLALGKEAYLMNETMKACVVMVDTLSPMTVWVTVCPPEQHMLSLFHSPNVSLSLGPCESMGDSVSTRATHAFIVSFINLSSACK